MLPCFTVSDDRMFRMSVSFTTPVREVMPFESIPMEKFFLTSELNIAGTTEAVSKLNTEFSTSLERTTSIMSEELYPME